MYVFTHIIILKFQGKYDIIIASDELALEEPSNKSSQVTKKTNHRRKSDKEFGVSRGIDFQCVANVINFDFPLELNSYIHRAGRTARGNNKVSSVSLIFSSDIVLVSNR